MKFSFRNCIAALALLFFGALAGTIGPVQHAISQGMVQITSLTGTEQISLNYPCTVSCFATSATLSNYGLSQPGGNMDNSLIGGDSDLNLYQRGTTGSSVTTTITYGGPDRWAYWSGTATAMTVSKTTTAADLPGTFTFGSGFKMARTSGQTGVVPVCMMQEVETVNSYQFSGTVAELDFHATAGANFSAASNVMTAYLISGTDVNGGTSNAAFGLNTGGGSATAWTTQANQAVTFTLTTTNTRYGAAFLVPAGTTEVAVALCYTPVGTAGTNDYIAFSGIQLTRNSSLASVAGTTQGALAPNDTRAKAFARRLQAIETEMQQRFYYQITDSVANTVPIALCQATTTTAIVCPIPFPVTMRAAPTATASATTAFGFTATAGAPTACTAFAVVASSTSAAAGKVTCTTGATVTAGGSSQLVGANTTANVHFAAEL